MEKYAFIPKEDDFGINVFPLFGKGQATFEKIAAPRIVPSVARFIDGFQPKRGFQYILVNAMGASEYWGSNSNADGWPEAALIHAPSDWRGDPRVDRERARTWSYGYPTFYNAHVFRNHRNKDPSKALGLVELAAWNPHMKRVELVMHFNEEWCRKFDGMYFWDKLSAGDYIDVSMGAKIPYDVCTLHAKRSQIEDIIRRYYKPEKHAHPGLAVLEHHKMLIATTGRGIPGVAETRKQYCEEMLRTPNRILPSGLKIYVDNDYPRFFDISGVFIGADKTAKTMRHLGKWVAHVGVDDGYAKVAENMGLNLKRAETEKRGPPQVGHGVRLATDREEDLPRDALRSLAGMGLPLALSGLTSAGIILRPREFQRIVLIRMGKEGLADDLEQDGHVFPMGEREERCSCDEPAGELGRVLASMFPNRSLFGPQLHKRVSILIVKGSPAVKTASLSHPALLKMGELYRGYRKSVLETLPTLVKTSEVDHLLSTWGVSREELLPGSSLGYAKVAFLDELPRAQAGSTR